MHKFGDLRVGDAFIVEGLRYVKIDPYGALLNNSFRHYAFLPDTDVEIGDIDETL